LAREEVEGGRIVATEILKRNKIARELRFHVLDMHSARARTLLYLEWKYL